MKNTVKTQHSTRQAGFSLPELVVVVLILAILAALALPQIISSRKLFTFTNQQNQIVASLRDARQSAITQRKAITVRYDESESEFIIYGGSYGTLGDSQNQKIQMAGGGLDKTDIIYGRPGGVSSVPLSDGVDLSADPGGIVEFTFQSDGSVLDAAGNPQNFGLFFYLQEAPTDNAFAISILGAGGRVKLWRYNTGAGKYVE